MNDDRDNLGHFIAACNRLEEPAILELDAGDLSNLLVAIELALAAMESVEKGELIPYLIERLGIEDDDEYQSARNLLDAERDSLLKLRALLSSEHAGHPGVLALRDAFRRRSC